MFRILQERIRQKDRTIAYPKAEPVLPERFRGLPVIHSEKCEDFCACCIQSCPTQALSNTSGTLELDMGRCLFCTDCMEACPKQAIEFTRQYQLATRHRKDLLCRKDKVHALAKSLDVQSKKIFGRSLKLRQVSAGGCNACEADVNVLNTVVFDLGRFGIQFVASPRHADGILVTGTVPKNMMVALNKTYDAIPDPKLVIAVGVCAISGGVFQEMDGANMGVEQVLPVDLYIPGCPPHPMTILDGLLRLIGKLERESQKLIY